MRLVTTPNLSDRDAAYAALITAHEGLTGAESAAFNARLILILMNHVGDADVLEEALALAAKSDGRDPKRYD